MLVEPTPKNGPLSHLPAAKRGDAEPILGTSRRSTTIVVLLGAFGAGRDYQVHDGAALGHLAGGGGQAGAAVVVQRLLRCRCLRNYPERRFSCGGSTGERTENANSYR